MSRSGSHRPSQKLTELHPALVEPGGDEHPHARGDPHHNPKKQPAGEQHTNNPPTSEFGRSVPVMTPHDGQRWHQSTFAVEVQCLGVADDHAQPHIGHADLVQVLVDDVEQQGANTTGAF